MSPGAKAEDRNLAGLQGFVLGAAIPLVNMMESARSGSLNSRDAAESAQQALKLLQNASVYISVERPLKASSCLNKGLAPLIADETTFKDATPLLFGDSFQQRMRDHTETIRNLRQPQFSSYQHSFGGGAIPYSRKEVVITGAEETRNISPLSQEYILSSNWTLLPMDPVSLILCFV